jgi:hypothetical protein
MEPETSTTNVSAAGGRSPSGAVRVARPTRTSDQPSLPVRAPSTVTLKPLPCGRS